MTNTNNTSQSGRVITRRSILRGATLTALLSITGTNVSAATTDSKGASSSSSVDETSLLTEYQDNVLWYRIGDKSDREAFHDAVATAGGGVTTLGIATVEDDRTEGWQYDWTTDGDKRWTALHGQSGRDALFGGTRTTTNGYAICGHSRSENADTTQVYVVETNRRGRDRWTTRFHLDQRVDDRATDIVQTTDGKFVIAGSSATRATMATLDATGDVQWTHTYAGGESLEAVSILETDDGFVLGGTVTDQDETTACFLLKTDSRGQEQWRRRYRTGKASRLAECISTETGYLIAGTTKQENAFTTDALVVKTTLQGDVVWEQTYGQPGAHSTANSVTAIGDSYVIAGSRSEDLIGQQVWLNQLDKSGNRTWSTTFGTEREETPYEIVPTKDGNLAICGTRNPADSNDCYEGFVVKVTLAC